MSQNLPQMTKDQVEMISFLTYCLYSLSTDQLEQLHAKQTKRVEYKIDAEAWDTAYHIGWLRAVSKALSARYIKDAKAMNYRTFVH